ncbi:hypothetical protein P8605_41955 [Streptomyces sp. T-3]|nr:hypothetical protein [Streptomyces sp. T-3]
MTTQLRKDPAPLRTAPRAAEPPLVRDKSLRTCIPAAPDLGAPDEGGRFGKEWNIVRGED